MSKIILTLGNCYCGSPSEEIEIKYDGTEKEFEYDERVATKILDAIQSMEHYFLDIEFVEEDVEVEE